MDDHLTISFGDDSQSQLKPTPDAGTICRQVDDTKYPPPWLGSDGDTSMGFGDGHRYRLIRELGRGGMGTVYEGWDAQLCRSVAIKIMDEAQRIRLGGRERFLREARIASQLAHPGIVTIHEFGTTSDGHAFIVMELLRGQTLRQVLQGITDRDGSLPRLLNCFSEVCQAMASAHSRGVIHRDLKPSNIMVCPYGVVSVMDWGVAKVISEPHPTPATTADHQPPLPPATVPVDDIDPTTTLLDRGNTLCGTVFGTPAYIPPEQARGEIDQIDFRSDVFGLGSVLCEILTGQAPFTAETVDDRYRQAASGDLRDAFERLDRSGAPLPLVSLAKRCLAASPQARPADAREVADAVIAYLESGQRRAEQELVRFFDLSLDLFCIAGLNGIFHRLNDNVKDLLGYEASQLTGKPFLDYVHPDDRERTRHEMATLAEEIPTIHFLNRYRHVDGHYVWLEWNAHTVSEEAAVYAVARDVSDRMTAAAIQSQMVRERETVAALTAAAGLFLTASGVLIDRLRYVVEEGAAQLGLVAMEVWRGGEAGLAIERLVTSSPEVNSVSSLLIEQILASQQPQQFTLDTMPAPLSMPAEVACVAGYPLALGGRPLGVVAVYAKERLSSMHVMAMSPLVASLTLAMAADR